MRSSRHRFVVLVAPAGVVGGHAIGYLVAGSGHGSHGVNHHYLPLAAAITVPLLLGSLLWAAARPGPAGGHRLRAPLGLLVATQWVLFVGQELVEHAVAGDASALLHSRALWFGLAAQVAVAAATTVLLSAATWAGGRALHILLRGPSRRTSAPARVFRRDASGWRVPGDVLRSAITSRGPPPRPC